jgi:hypothetical protein
MKFMFGFVMLIAIGVNAQEPVLNAAFLSPKKTYPLHVEIGDQSDPMSHKMYARIEETGEDTPRGSPKSGHVGSAENRP